MTLWQLRSNLCLAHTLMAMNENKIDGTEKAMLNHSTALGLNQMSSMAGSGPTKTDCGKRGGFDRTWEGGGMPGKELISHALVSDSLVENDKV